MEHELLEHIIKTETLSIEMKDVVDGIIKFKSRVIFFLKTLVVIHISTACAVLYFYPEILSVNNSLGFIALLINIGINLSLLACIRLREKKLSKLKNQCH